MDLDFYKTQTVGNDLILTNLTQLEKLKDEELFKIARHVCRRDYGIGGNGLIAIRELSGASIKASFISPYGKPACTTTDAAFCLSRYVFDSGVAGKEDFKLTINETEHSVGIIDSNFFRISLGVPLNEDGTMLIESPEIDYIQQISAAGRDFPATIITLQKTGVVVFSEACNISQLKNMSDEILKAANLNDTHRLIFATVNSREEIEVHIRNSRGDDFSSSCAIAAAASVVNGFLDRNSTIIHKFGEFYFQWLQPSNEIFLTGAADYIFSGSIYLDL